MDTISFVGEDDEVEVVDRVERRRYALGLSGAASPRPASTDRFAFPVDAAVTVESESVTLATAIPVYVRDDEGEMVVEVEYGGFESVPEGSYSIEVCAPIKIYLRVDAAVTVYSDAERTYLTFDREREVAIGARSLHERPAGTVTTTGDPADVMAAVSTFGSALKTTSPERSYPTLRGHPPLVEVGDELDVPDGLEPPETGVRLELPPERRYAYVAAPLAYYLGAEVVPGDRPRLVAGGAEHPLDSPLGFEAEVERTLKRTFLLDCVTRTEGLYPVDLHERAEVERAVDLDFADLYDRPLAEQVAAYLSVPYPSVEPHVPEWKLTTHVSPGPESAELLPFVVDDLAVIRSGGAATDAPATQRAAVDEFVRSGSASDASGLEYVQPEPAASLEQAWIGDATPVGASKLTAEAFRNRIDRAPADGDIDITVVCNDHDMDEERAVVDEVYGSRADLPFDVAVRRDLTPDELRALLAEETDLLHYIGHIDRDGFECLGGKLDAGTLDAVGVDAFILNACASYEQGMALIDAGGIGGIVTLSDVVNSGAVRVGSTVARLLDCGFPLNAALSVAEGESIVSNRYIVVGDGGLAVSQAQSGTPYLVEVQPEGDGFEVGVETYTTSDRGMGSLFIPYAGEKTEYFLNSGSIGAFRMSADELEEFLGLEKVPVRVDGRLRWSGDLDVSDL